MKRPSPKTILIIGFALALTGAVLPFLMTVHALESTLFLNLLSWGAQVTGLLLSPIGAVLYIHANKRQSQ
jgi:hypothetical protein